MIPLILHKKGPVQLPYSGTVSNPSFQPTGPVHAYDIGGTLVRMSDRDRVLMAALQTTTPIKELFFNDPVQTQRISDMQRDLVREGKITVEQLGAVEANLAEQDAIAITVGTNTMAQSCLEGAGIYSINGLVSTEDAYAKRFTDTPKKKTADIFLATAAVLESKGSGFSSYTDDSATDALAAATAREALMVGYGQQAGFFPIYLIQPKAEETGENDQGLIVVRSVEDKWNLESLLPGD